MTIITVSIYECLCVIFYSALPPFDREDQDRVFDREDDLPKVTELVWGVIVESSFFAEFFRLNQNILVTTDVSLLFDLHLEDVAVSSYSSKGLTEIQASTFQELSRFNGKKLAERK